MIKLELTYNTSNGVESGSIKFDGESNQILIERPVMSGYLSAAEALDKFDPNELEMIILTSFGELAGKIREYYQGGVEVARPYDGEVLEPVGEMPSHMNTNKRMWPVIGVSAREMGNEVEDRYDGGDDEIMEESDVDSDDDFEPMVKSISQNERA